MNKSYYVNMLDDMNLPLLYLIGDHYVAQLKGALKQLSADIEIFDICNTVQTFNRMQAGYILRITYPFFPAGAIHLVGVNSEPSAKNKILLVKHDGHYFVGADSGLYNIICNEKEPELAYELVPESLYGSVSNLTPRSFFDPGSELNRSGKISGFSAVKIFAAVVNHIMRKKEISELGKPTKINMERKMHKANYTMDSIAGNVVFIDHFGNIITNISRELFDRIGHGRSFNILVRGSKKFAISKISTEYVASEKKNEQHYQAIFNSSGFLEIAQFGHNFAQEESIDISADVNINFSKEMSGDLFN
ncbi:MAG: SAM-dependent chlorinase/fluorinase [Prevotellaceae bacterium]|nr:SAM-dependent chlorinase/fluorinase [Prevotellaceae bacterium]